MKIEIFYVLLYLPLFSFLIDAALAEMTTNDYFKYERLYYAKKFDTRRDFRLDFRPVDFVCNDTRIDCSGNGQCAEDKKSCICTKGYMTPESSYIQCSYQQKSRWIAIAIEGTIGFGFGHLYVGNYTFFIAKFLFYFFSCYFSFCVMIFVGSINNSNVNPDTYKYTKRSTIILVPLMLIWYFTDVVMFAMGKYQDGKDQSLY